MVPVAYPTAVVVLGYWMMHTPPLVPAGLGLCLVFQLVASQMALPSRGGCRSRLFVVPVAFRLVVTSVVIVLAVLIFFLLLRPGHCLRVVLGAVVGQILMLMHIVLLVFVMLFVVLHRRNLLVHYRYCLGYILLGLTCVDCHGSSFRLHAPSSQRC